MMMMTTREKRLKQIEICYGMIPWPKEKIDKLMEKSLKTSDYSTLSDELLDTALEYVKMVFTGRVRFCDPCAEANWVSNNPIAKCCESCTERVKIEFAENKRKQEDPEWPPIDWPT